MRAENVFVQEMLIHLLNGTIVRLKEMYYRMDTIPQDNLPHKHLSPLFDLALMERWKTKITLAENGCWEWTGTLDGKGYGRMYDKRFPGKKKERPAHVVGYELFIGPIPEGLEVDHLCRNHRCVNPDHLEPVTHRENVLRGASPWADQMKRTHCPNGHPYDSTNNRGERICRVCIREQQRKANRRVKGYPEEGPLSLKTHCKHGHEFTPENTLIAYVDGKRGRRCRICREQQRKEDQRKTNEKRRAKRAAS